MASEKPETLSEAIRQHQEWMRYGDYLLSESTRCERDQAEVYRKIKQALDRPELKNVAVVDPISQTVYCLDSQGLVVSKRLAYADNVKISQEVLHETDSVVILGEAS